MGDSGDKVSPRAPSSGRSGQKEVEPPPEPEIIRRISQIIHMPAFDHVMGVVIMLNMGVIIIETDHAADNDTSLQWLDSLGWVILVVFIIELVARLIVLRISFFKDHWNSFDFIIVVTDSLFSILGLVLGSVFPMSTLRVFRLCKLARVSKVFRVFPELRIMMAGLIGSFRAIFWGTVLLAFVLLVWSIVAVQFIHPLSKELDEQGVFEALGCERCPRAYASVMQSTLTFTQQIVTGDSWGQATIPLIEAYPVTALYFAAVFLSVGFAVMNLILGVVVNVAQSEHDKLKEELNEEKALRKMEASSNLINICADMDKDGSGELSKAELLGGYTDREDFRASIAELELSQEDLGIAFASMDADKSGSVSYNEFVKKIYKMKESDSQFLMEQIKYNIMTIKDAVVNRLCVQEDQLIALEERMVAQLERLRVLNPGEEGRVSDTPAPNEKRGAEEQLLQDSSSTTAKSQARGSDEKKDDMANLPLQLVGGEGQVEIREALNNISQHLHCEVRDNLQMSSRLKTIEESLALQVSHTASLLSRLSSQKQLEDSVSARGSSLRQNMSSGFMPAPLCCKV